ncbi:hypothetical protein HK097_011353 [Rhizophlyctis rosea]|uniref:Uncharacterized protein n=1 Tax=Rhizophlyctis rosea TaxID=64517 RepID=A0AAD5WZZ0_9FUNG|nr:hypothetical protein HK097_011353 [Rhizophlyctis rosea]
MGGGVEMAMPMLMALPPAKKEEEKPLHAGVVRLAPPPKGKNKPMPLAALRKFSFNDSNATLVPSAPGVVAPAVTRPDIVALEVLRKDSVNSSQATLLPPTSGGRPTSSVGGGTFGRPVSTAAFATGVSARSDVAIRTPSTLAATSRTGTIKSDGVFTGLPAGSKTPTVSTNSADRVIGSFERDIYAQFPEFRILGMAAPTAQPTSPVSNPRTVHFPIASETKQTTIAPPQIHTLPASPLSPPPSILNAPVPISRLDGEVKKRPEFANLDIPMRNDETLVRSENGEDNEDTDDVANSMVMQSRKDQEIAKYRY